MLSYQKLWILLENRKMKKTDLKKVISSVTLAKLGKNETVSTETVEKICAFLDCQPGDIMEYISEENMKNVIEQMDIANKALFETLKEKGVTEEQFASLISQAMPNIVKSIYAGENTLSNLFEDTLEQNKHE